MSRLSSLFIFAFQKGKPEVPYGSPCLGALGLLLCLGAASPSGPLRTRCAPVTQVLPRERLRAAGCSGGSECGTEQFAHHGDRQLFSVSCHRGHLLNVRLQLGRKAWGRARCTCEGSSCVPVEKVDVCSWHVWGCTNPAKGTATPPSLTTWGCLLIAGTLLPALPHPRPRSPPVWWSLRTPGFKAIAPLPELELRRPWAPRRPAWTPAPGPPSWPSQPLLGCRNRGAGCGGRWHL